MEIKSELEEFIDTVKQHVTVYNSLYDCSSVNFFNNKAKPVVSDQFIKSDHWRSGGVSGGNCWSSGGHYSLDPEPEEELKDLDTVLLALAPNISFLQYKRISSHIKFHDWNENEYYGNYTNYRFKYILLSDLLTELASMGII